MGRKYNQYKKVLRGIDPRLILIEEFKLFNKINYKII